MKKVIITLFALFLSAPISTANALMVDLLGSTYSYDLFQEYEISDPSQPIGSGSERVIGSSSQPISRTITMWPDIPIAHNSEITADAFSLYARSESANSVYPSHAAGHAFVTASWLFRPIDNFDELVLNKEFGGGSWNAGYITLTDVTENRQIFSGASVGLLDYYIQQYFSDSWKGPEDNSLFLLSELVIDNLFVDDHYYQIDVGLLAQSVSDVWSAGFSADMQAAQVPEPQTLFSLGLGLAFVVTIQRKKCFNKN